MEEAVLAQALALLGRLALAAIVVGDRGLGRKELRVRRYRPRQDFVLRIDADFLAYGSAAPDGCVLATLLAAQPWLGAGRVVGWERGQEGPLPCRARALTATIRFSRPGRQADDQEAPLQFLELIPLDGSTDPRVLATTLPIDTLADAAGVARV